jgi:gluconolactonase
MTLDRVVGSPPKIEKIAEGFTFTEGPVFSRIGFLLFTDVRAEPPKILRWENGKVTTFREKSNRANGLTFDHQGRLLTCERDRVTRTEKDGSVTVLASAFEGSPLLSPNDLVYAIDGSIYFSVIKPRAIEGRDNPGLFQITRNGRLRLASRECTRPNGVALAPNQQRLFVADSEERNVRVFDINGDGSLKSGRIFCQVKGEAPSGPDGLKTDESGNVWVAGPGGIWVFDAAGEHLGKITLPETPSNCAWGAGFRNLYVTAVSSVYRIETKVNGTRTY